MQTTWPLMLHFWRRRFSVRERSQVQNTWCRLVKSFVGCSALVRTNSTKLIRLSKKVIHQTSRPQRSWIKRTESVMPNSTRRGFGARTSRAKAYPTHCLPNLLLPRPSHCPASAQWARSSSRSLPSSHRALAATERFALFTNMSCYELDRLLCPRACTYAGLSTAASKYAVNALSAQFGEVSTFSEREKRDAGLIDGGIFRGLRISCGVYIAMHNLNSRTSVHSWRK